MKITILSVGKVKEKFYRDAIAEFEKRLRNFIRKTRENKLITGYGGIEKYYR